MLTLSQFQNLDTDFFKKANKSCIVCTVFSIDGKEQGRRKAVDRLQSSLGGVRLLVSLDTSSKLTTVEDLAAPNHTLSDPTPTHTGYKRFSEIFRDHATASRGLCRFQST